MQVLKYVGITKQISYGYVRTRGEKKQILQKLIHCFTEQKKEVHVEKKREISNLVNEMSDLIILNAPLIKLLLI